MADIAAVFHWGPEVMGDMSLPVLMGWRVKAVARFEAMNKVA